MLVVQGSVQRTQRVHAANLIVAVVILSVAIVLVWRMGDPLGIRADSWSEAEVIISGLGYAAGGFCAHAALPQHQIGPPIDPYFLYANYPILSNVLNGLLQLIGADAYGLYRLPAILASLIALWLWYRLIARVVDRVTGVAATVALGSSLGFLAYADNIHQQAYPLAPQFGALLCLSIGVAPHTTRRRTWFLGCALCLLLVALLTVELHLWLMIAILGYTLLFGTAVRRRWVVLLALPLLAGLALQWFQSWAGSPVPPQDRPGLLQSLYRRSIGFEDAPDTPSESPGRRVSLASYPRFMAQRFYEFYRIPVWVVPLLLLIGFVGGGPFTWHPKTWPPPVKLLLLLLAAGLGWMGTMMQQTAVHQATLRQLLPFYGLLLGVVWARAVVIATHRSPAWQYTVVLAAFALLIPHCSATWSNMQMHLDHSYWHPLLKQPGWGESADLAPLRSLPPRSVILTNHNRLPLIRYWARRPVYQALDVTIPAAQAPRNWLEVTVNYLRGLYGDELPQLVYMYRVTNPTPGNIQRAVAADPFLRLLTTGNWDPQASEETQRRAARAFVGEVPAACPILLMGSDWRAFDMTPIMPLLLHTFAPFPTPRLKDMPAPR